MERDFLGLNSKDSVIVVKEEAVELCKDSAFNRGVAVQWPFSNTFDPSNRRHLGEIQKNINHNRQGGAHFMTAYAMQQSAHSVMFAGSNQTVPVTMSNPFFKTHYAGAAQNFAGAPMKQQLLGGVPVTTTHSILPCIGSFAGTTEPWFNSKASRGPAQLTIFYEGAVNVFDDISPEKAQAIMFLAGNGSIAATNIEQPKAQVQLPTSKVAAGDVYVNQHMNTPPCSGLSSPISVSSHTVGQSGGNPTNIDEPAKTTGGSVTPISKVDPPKVLTSLGTVTVTTMMPSAVPQARKASLARFLEKRKERVMNSAPYDLSKQSAECAANPGSNAVSFSASSRVGSGN